MFYRPDIDKFNKTQMIIGALTIGVWRLTFAYFGYFLFGFTRLFAYGADVNKPYSPLRRFFIRSIFSIKARIEMFASGFYWIPIKTLKI